MNQMAAGHCATLAGMTLINDAGDVFGLYPFEIKFRHLALGALPGPFRPFSSRGPTAHVHPRSPKALNRLTLDALSLRWLESYSFKSLRFLSHSLCNFGSWLHYTK